MAGQMTHMVIAYDLIKRLGIKEGKAEFVLGCVAPDSVPFTEPERKEKIHSHLFENCGPWGDTQDYDNWLVNIKAFWNKYGVGEEDKKKKAFLLGICVHCLTDYWNDLYIWRGLQKKMMPPMTLDEFKEAYYPEAGRIDKWLFQNAEHTDEIRKLIIESEEMDFEDYAYADNLADIKRWMIDDQYNLSEQIVVSDHKYYTSDMNLWFIKEATSKIIEQLKEYDSVNMLTRVYFVRHAQPNYGNHDDLLRELSPCGMEDRKLVTTFLEDKGIDVVLSSPFKRAVDTVADFADTHNLTVETIEDFRERKVDSCWIEDFTSFSKRQWSDFTYKLSDGECLKEVQDRNIAALNDVLNKYTGKNIVIGSHGTALSTIINFYDNTFDYEDFDKIRFIMPWIVEFVFDEKKNCVEINKFDPKNA